MGQDYQVGGVLCARVGEELVECGAQVGRGELGGDGDVAGVAVLGDGSEQQQLARAEHRCRPVGRGRGHLLGGEQAVHDHRGLAAGRAVEALADVADVLADGHR